MLGQIKSEFQKLLTIRSTYVLLAIYLGIATFVSFYVMGYRGAINLSESRAIAGIVSIIITNLVFLISLIAVLRMTHEYRYNTIMYTLTAAKSRLRVLLAKFIVVSVFSVLATLAMAAVSGLLVYAGAEFGGRPVGTQDIPLWDVLWRISFFGWGYAMFALILAFIIRSQVGTIVTLIFLPDISTGLLSFLLKENTGYLPFAALSSVIHPSQFSFGKAALISTIYIIAGLIIAAVLFKKRDAS